MKKVSNQSRFISAFLSAYILIANPISLFAQDTSATQETALTDTLPESAYQINVPKHVVNVYSDFVPYVLFGIVIALILFVSFRYWYDNRPHHDLPHLPHQQ